MTFDQVLQFGYQLGALLDQIQQVDQQLGQVQAGIMASKEFHPTQHKQLLEQRLQMQHARDHLLNTVLEFAKASTLDSARKSLRDLEVRKQWHEKDLDAIAGIEMAIEMAIEFNPEDRPKLTEQLELSRKRAAASFEKLEAVVPNRPLLVA